MIRQLTQAILRQLAVIKLARTKPTIVGITGSVGKTTTKEAIFSVLQGAWGDRVQRSAGNLNTEEGVPLAILGFTETPSRWEYPAILIKALGRALFSTRGSVEPVLVLELSAEKPGDIEYLATIVAPYLSVGVVTTVGPIHLNEGQFSSIAAIAQEKGKLAAALPAGGWALLNKDNPYTKAMAKNTKAKVVWFPEKGMDTGLIIARKVGRLFKIKEEVIAESLGKFKRPKGRWTELKGIKETILIDDSYNANPMSMEESLKHLAARPGRKIAVLGDMLELGSREKVYHIQVGKLARSQADIIIGMGRRARWYNATYHFARPQEAASFIKKFIKRGDTILIKGSQSMRMEMVTESLLLMPGDADKLPRQSLSWKAKPFVQP